MTTSTINPNIPDPGQPVSSSPIRDNFAAAYNDINNIYNIIGTGSGTVTSVSVVDANGVSGVVSNPTTTPAITISLGAITPSSVAASGAVTGSNLSGTNTGDQTITLSGDIGGSGTGSIVTTIGVSKVRYSNIQNVTALSLIGNPTVSDAAPTAIGLGSGLSISGGNLVATGGSGTVTSVAISGSNGIGVSGSPITSSGTITLSLGAITPTSINASGTVVGSNLSGTNTGNVTLAGQNYITIAGQVITAAAVDLSGSNATGILAAARFPALTGDITTSSGSLTTAIGANKVTTTTIAANAVTNAKMATGTTNSLAGYDGSGLFSNVTVGSGLSLSGGTITVTGGGITLETDGTPNGSQSVLNLVGGTNITLTDNGLGAITIDASGSIATGFDAISSGTNTSAAMVVGTGGSLAVSGSGTIAATSVSNATLTTALTVNTGTVTLTGNAANTSVLTIGAGAVSVSGSNTGDQTITLTGAVAGSGTGSFATTIATPGTLTVSSTNSTATAHTHAITSSSAPGAAASILATDSSGIIGSTGTRIVKGWFTDLTVTNAISGSVTGNAGTATALQNARTIGGVSFDGTANITVSSATGGFTITGGDLVMGANNITITGSIGSTGSRATKGWFTDLQVTNAISGSITGNAATATALQTARSIGGVSFDGTASIVPQSIQTADESSDTTCFPAFFVSSGTQTGGQLPKTNSGLTYNSNTNNLGATTFTGALTGNASTATALQNARTIGGVSFDGTANITVATATGGFTVSGGDLALGANNLTITGSIGSTGSRSTKGWFTDLQVTNAIAGSVTGNAATATALQSARTIGGVSFDGTANITVATATGGFTVSGGDLAIGANNLTVTGSIASTGSRVTKGWFTDLEVTNAATSGGVAIPTISSTNTLTNKRVTKRTGTTTSSATPTINTDNVDFYSITAQTVDITSFTTNLSGTPTEAQTLWIAITGTAARAITWGASFEASTVALPTTTVSTNRLDVGFVWNTVSQKWRCVSTC